MKFNSALLLLAFAGPILLDGVAEVKKRDAVANSNYQQKPKEIQAILKTTLQM
ncbi:20424_t:CDS:2 [Funneliformis geosporum]|uniref:7088_t:CDS:1 n=1 Tax=Funneliformis geosporum TaxID=1117311 RepID=A0A9W4WMM8_9GLOM|nr:20424_t:CDS:2 [Funneliformis geosporum]CAI2165266.1 7088_t:CDS:2 [Funneliformis geosporum]